MSSPRTARPPMNHKAAGQHQRHPAAFAHAAAAAGSDDGGVLAAAAAAPRVVPSSRTTKQHQPPHKAAARGSSSNTSSGSSRSTKKTMFVLPPFPQPKKKKQHGSSNSNQGRQQQHSSAVLSSSPLVATTTTTTTVKAAVVGAGAADVSSSSDATTTTTTRRSTSSTPKKNINNNNHSIKKNVDGGATSSTTTSNKNATTMPLSPTNKNRNSNGSSSSSILVTTTTTPEKKKQQHRRRQQEEPQRAVSTSKSSSKRNNQQPQQQQQAQAQKVDEAAVRNQQQPQSPLTSSDNARPDHCSCAHGSSASSSSTPTKKRCATRPGTPWRPTMTSREENKNSSGGGISTPSNHRRRHHPSVPKRNETTELRLEVFPPAAAVAASASASPGKKKKKRIPTAGAAGNDDGGGGDERHETTTTISDDKRGKSHYAPLLLSLPTTTTTEEEEKAPATTTTRHNQTTTVAAVDDSTQEMPPRVSTGAPSFLTRTAPVVDQPQQRRRHSSSMPDAVPSSSLSSLGAPTVPRAAAHCAAAAASSLAALMAVHKEFSKPLARRKHLREVHLELLQPRRRRRPSASLHALLAKPADIQRRPPLRKHAAARVKDYSIAAAADTSYDDEDDDNNDWMEEEDWQRELQAAWANEEAGVGKRKVQNTSDDDDDDDDSVSESRKTKRKRTASAQDSSSKNFAEIDDSSTALNNEATLALGRSQRKCTKKENVGIDPAAGEPKLPPDAYTMFSQENRHLLEKEHPDFSRVEILASVRDLWRNLQESEKAKYHDREAEANREYRQQKKAWKDYQKELEKPIAERSKKRKAAEKDQTRNRAIHKPKSPLSSSKSRKSTRSKSNLRLLHGQLERQADGTFPQPRGRPPAGLVWDGFLGTWVSKSDAMSAAIKSRSESLPVKVLNYSSRKKKTIPSSSGGLAEDSLFRLSRMEGPTPDNRIRRQARKVSRSTLIRQSVAARSNRGSSSLFRDRGLDAAWVDDDGDDFGLMGIDADSQDGTKHNVEEGQRIQRKMKVSSRKDFNGERKKLAGANCDGDKGRKQSSKKSTAAGNIVVKQTKSTSSHKFTDDGHRIPEKSPVRKSDGTFARPVGRPINGFAWNAARGLWAPVDAVEPVAAARPKKARCLSSAEPRFIPCEGCVGCKMKVNCDSCLQCLLRADAAPDTQSHFVCMQRVCSAPTPNPNYRMERPRKRDAPLDSMANTSTSHSSGARPCVSARQQAQISERLYGKPSSSPCLQRANSILSTL